MLLTAVPQVSTVRTDHKNKVKFNISIRKCKTKTSDQRKHCSVNATVWHKAQGTEVERGVSPLRLLRNALLAC